MESPTQQRRDYPPTPGAPRVNRKRNAGDNIVNGVNLTVLLAELLPPTEWIRDLNVSLAATSDAYTADVIGSQIYSLAVNWHEFFANARLACFCIGDGALGEMVVQESTTGAPASYTWDCVAKKKMALLDMADKITASYSVCLDNEH